VTARPAATELNLRARRIPMRAAEVATVALGGVVRRTGSDELEFSHWSMARKVVAKTTRRETSDVLIAWLRHLYRNRAALRRALGFPAEGRFE